MASESKSDTMKALSFTEPGSIDNFKVVDADKPTPGPKDILVKIKSVALNPVDWKVRVTRGALGLHN